MSTVSTITDLTMAVFAITVGILAFAPSPVPPSPDVQAECSEACADLVLPRSGHGASWSASPQALERAHGLDAHRTERSGHLSARWRDIARRTIRWLGQGWSVGRRLIGRRLAGQGWPVGRRLVGQRWPVGR